MNRTGSTRVREVFKVCSIVAATAVVMGLAAPLGAVAAGQLVTLVDDDTPTKAQVDTGGKLRVGDGAGSLTVNGSVNVTSSPADPVSAREAPKVFGDTASVFLNAGATGCTNLELAAGRLARIESVVVSAGGAAAPTAWLRVWGEPTEGDFFAVDGKLTLAQSNTSFYPWTGISEIGMPVAGGNAASANGVPANVQLCGRAPSGNSTTIAFTVSGVYLDA